MPGLPPALFCASPRKSGRVCLRGSSGLPFVFSPPGRGMLTASREALFERVKRECLAVPQAWIKIIAESVAERIESEDGKSQREAGEDGEPRRSLHVGAAGTTQHPTPRGRWRRRTEAQKAERSVGEYGASEPPAV